MADVTPAALASWLCSTTLDVPSCSLVLEDTILRLPAADFVGYVDRMQQACARFRETPLLDSVLSRALLLDPAWAAEVAAHLAAPETLFGSLGEAPVQMTEPFLRAGDESLMGVIEDGARGYFGGSSEQRHRAAVIAAVVHGPGAEYLEFLESLLDSPVTGADGPLGGFLVHFLIQPKALVDGSSSRAQAALLRALDDPRFMLGAAIELVHGYGDEAPAGFGLGEWTEAMERARAIVRAQ